MSLFDSGHGLPRTPSNLCNVPFTSSQPIISLHLCVTCTSSLHDCLLHLSAENSCLFPMESLAHELKL